MSQKSSVPQAISFVSQVLKRDTAKRIPSGPKARCAEQKTEVRLCERLGVKFPRPLRQTRWGATQQHRAAEKASEL